MPRGRPLTAAEARLRSFSEAQFQEQVVALAQTTGWWVWHDQDSRRNRAGLPDLILIRPPRLVFLELKREVRSKARLQQRVVLEMLQRCPGVEAHLVRPSDFQDVVALLRARTAPPRETPPP